MAYLAPTEFVTKMVDAGESKLLMSTRDTLIRSYMAGAILSLAAAFAVSITVSTGNALAGAVLFPVGFILLYLLGFDLLTGVFTLAPLAVFDKRPGATWQAVWRNWGLVFSGNFAGALTVAVFMANTWLQAAEILGFTVHVSTPGGYEVDPKVAGVSNASCYKVFASPLDACRGADLVTTDVWTSMGYEAENEQRREAFADWCVDAEMMAAARPDALFMHCLPAHRGEEVSAEVIDGAQSVVWDEAENRLHAQKALMEYLLLGRIG